MRLAVVLSLLAAPAMADVDAAVDGVILPGVAGFAAAAQGLADAAAADCTRAAVMPAYRAAFAAWVRVGDLRIGPSEAAALTIAFWPDERGSGAKAVAALLKAADPAALEPAAVAQMSAAARGFPGLDLLLGDARLDFAPGSPGCAAVQALAADLAVQAAALAEGWVAHGALLREPGSAGNVAYLDETEAQRAIYGQILEGMEFTIDSRLGRPLGTFEAPKPTRAEFWRTGQSLTAVLGAARAARDLSVALAGSPLPGVEAALASVEEAGAKIADPSFQDIATPGARLKVEILQQRMDTLKDEIAEELGEGYGLSAGFNSKDGD